jgi:hypothetical protein
MPIARLAGALLAAGSLAAGCDKPQVGPKRPDHQAAHTQHYHPEIAPAVRRSAGSLYEEAPGPAAASAPAAAPPVSSRPGPVGSPVLFVNGETVSVPEILEPLLEELKADARNMSPQAYASALYRAVRRQIDLHVSTILIYQEAKTSYPDKAMEVFDKEVDRRIKEAINDRFNGIHARYEAQLKAMDLTMNDVKARIKRQVIVSQYMREKYKPLLREPPRRQLLKYYQDHLGDFTSPRQAELLLIEIPIETALGKPRNLATTEEIAQARRRSAAQLRRAREELDSGVEFAAVARAYSKGLKAAQGGSLGEISPGALQGRWARPCEILFTLSENQTSDVIETDESVFIVRCGRLVPARQISFEQAQEKIIERVKEEQFNRLSQEHVESLIVKATVQPLQDFTEAVIAAAPRPAPRNPEAAAEPRDEPGR